MEVYKRETEAVIRQFLRHGLTFPACVSALDAALARLMLRLRPEELPELRTVMLSNNDTVMQEMERRGPSGEKAK